MADPKAFVNVQRKEPKKRNVSDRLKDFNEIYKIMSDKDIKQQSERCMDCGIPFCHGIGCPLNNLIPEFNHLIYHGQWKQALKVLLKNHPFPEITGRVCPALCEAACVCGIDNEAVSIRQIELALVEKGFANDWITPELFENNSGCKIAVVGSGPAGLSAAKYLNQLGYEVTVYEKNKSCGGLLYYGIPDFKLEKNIVNRRINLMKESGIKFETGVEIGIDISMKYLNKKYDAIILACGALEPRDIKIQGRELDGIYFAMDLLVQQNKINNNEKLNDNENIINVKNKNVVVIGGGDTGADCVGTVNRLGAKKVYQLEIMPEPQKNRPDYMPWPEYPNILRSSTSHEEGCIRKWSISTKKFIGKNNNINKIECSELEWKFDDKGKPLTFKEKKLSNFFIDCDLVLIAAGFTGTGNNSLIEKNNIKLNEHNFVYVKDYNTNIKNIFCCGDMAEGPSLVVKALESGKRTALKVASVVS